jgi:CheY-like chemotaxis protein
MRAQRVSLLLRPLFPEGVSVLTSENSNAARAPERARRVFLIEDDGSYRWVIRRLLENAFGQDVSVEEFSTGEAALERAASDPPPDLVLLDLNLPGMDGFEVLRQVRAGERTRKVPVIIVTSSQEETDVQRAYEAGANSFVSKSDSPERTLQRLRLLPVYWLELNRLPERGGPEPSPLP